MRYFDLNKDWRTWFDNKYLGHQDLKRINNGNSVILTIMSIEEAEVETQDGKNICTVARFEPHTIKGKPFPDKPLILNKTRLRALESAFGSNKGIEFIGRQIEVFIIPNKWNPAEKMRTDTIGVRDAKAAKAKAGKNLTPQKLAKLAAKYRQDGGFEEIEQFVTLSERDKAKIVELSKEQ